MPIVLARWEREQAGARDPPVGDNAAQLLLENNRPSVATSPHSFKISIRFCFKNMGNQINK